MRFLSLFVSEGSLIFGWALKNVSSQLFKLCLIKSEGGQGLSGLRVSEEFLGYLRRGKGLLTHSRGEVPQETLLDIGVLHLAEGDIPIPLLLHVRLLERHVGQDLLQAVALLGHGGQDARLEEEFLELDEHPALLKALRLHAAVEDVLQLLKVGVLKDLLDLPVDELVELLGGRFLQGGNVLADFPEVGVSQLVVSEKLLKALVEGLLSSLMLLDTVEVLSS